MVDVIVDIDDMDDDVTAEDDDVTIGTIETPFDTKMTRY